MQSFPYSFAFPHAPFLPFRLSQMELEHKRERAGDPNPGPLKVIREIENPGRARFKIPIRLQAKIKVSEGGCAGVVTAEKRG